MPQIIKTHPRTIFLIVGDSDNSLGQQLKKTTMDENLQNNVIFTGYRQDIPQLLAAMDFTVNCSYSGEGLTGALRESLAMKKAAISTDVGGNKELIIDHETGLLIPANQLQSLVEALNYLLKNPAERIRMGEAGYKLIKEKFTLQTRISQMEKLYYDLLAE